MGGRGIPGVPPGETLQNPDTRFPRALMNGTARSPAQEPRQTSQIQETRNLTVVTPWTATYPDPISLTARDPVTLTGRQDLWNGHLWLWAIAPDHREGWIPDTAVEANLATITFDATELTCAADEALSLLNRTHGWTLCRAADGRQGWVPDTHLSESPLP